MFGFNNKNGKKIRVTVTYKDYAEAYVRLLVKHYGVQITYDTWVKKLTRKSGEYQAIFTVNSVDWYEFEKDLDPKLIVEYTAKDIQ